MSKLTVEMVLLLIKIRLDDAVTHLDSGNYAEVREHLVSAIQYTEVAFKIAKEKPLPRR